MKPEIDFKKMRGLAPAIVQDDATQTQFVSRYDPRTVPAADPAKQLVGRSLRMRATDHAAYGHVSGFNR